MLTITQTESLSIVYIATIFLIVVTAVSSFACCSNAVLTQPFTHLMIPTDGIESDKYSETQNIFFFVKFYSLFF